MKPRHQVSRAAIELIKKFEGYRRKAAQLPDGRWTIGYGHTLTAREGAEVSESDAEALLLYDLINISHTVNEHTYAPLSQNQFDALCCFAFNVGVENFRRSSVLRRVNEGQMLQAACAMEMWRKADFEGERIVIDALVRRRAAEKTLFLTPANGWVPAPSPVLPPKVDYDAVNAVPRETPAAVRAPLTGERAVAERDLTSTPRPIPPAQGPLATETAAASVTERLEKLFPEPIVVSPGPLTPVAPTADEEEVARVFEAFEESEAADLPPPTPSVVELPTPVSAPAPADTPRPAPVLAMVGGEPAFSLTPPPEVLPEEPQADVFHVDLPEPANESGPGLFDVSNANLDQPPPAQPMLSEDYIRRLVREDELAELGFDPDAAPVPVEPARISGLPLIGLAMLGMILFAGAVFWGLTTGEGMTNLYISWGFGLLGVGLVGIAAWRFLDGLAGGPDEEDEAAPAAE